MATPLATLTGVGRSVGGQPSALLPTLLLICLSQLVIGDQLARLTELAGLGQIRLELAAGRQAVPELSFS